MFEKEQEHFHRKLRASRSQFINNEPNHTPHPPLPLLLCFDATKAVKNDVGESFYDRNTVVDPTFYCSLNPLGRPSRFGLKQQPPPQVFYDRIFPITAFQNSFSVEFMWTIKMRSPFALVSSSVDVFLLSPSKQKRLNLLSPEVILQVVMLCFNIGQLDRRWASELLGYSLVCRSWLCALDLYWQIIEKSGKIFERRYCNPCLRKPLRLVSFLKKRPELIRKVRSISFKQYLATDSSLYPKGPMRQIIALAQEHLTSLHITDSQCYNASKFIMSLPCVAALGIDFADYNYADNNELLKLQRCICRWKYLKKLLLEWPSHSSVGRSVVSARFESFRLLKYSKDMTPAMRKARPKTQTV
jgi:hypothetical protein